MNPIIFRKYGKHGAYVLIVLILTGFIHGLIGTLFSLRTIVVYGDTVRIEIDKARLPDNLLFIRSGELERSIKQAYPLIESVRIEKRFPDTLTISIYTRKPVAVYVMGDRSVYVDEQGYVLGDVRDARALPVLTIGDVYAQTGERIADPQVLVSLEFIKYAGEYMNIRSITSYDNESVKIITNETNILITQNSNLMIVLPTLQTLIAGFRIRGTMPAVIDLRFTRPVIH